jgi:hypothetical protein
MSGPFLSAQDVLDEIDTERWDLVTLWCEEHPEIVPFTSQDVLYLLRCEELGLRVDLHTGTTLIPFMTPQERQNLEHARVQIEHWIGALEALGISDGRAPTIQPI